MFAAQIVRLADREVLRSAGCITGAKVKSENRFSTDEISSTRSILASMRSGKYALGIRQLKTLKDNIYAAIPDRQRTSRGITWTLKRIGDLIASACSDESEIKAFGLVLHENLGRADKLQGVPIFLMSEYGRKHPDEVLDFFKQAAGADEWEVREFAAGGFQKVLKPNRAPLQPWLKKMAVSENPNVRRFVSEMLRPVATGRWLRQKPLYSLGVLRHLFRESHPYPRTSVGNNLSDLSRYLPELIFPIIEELVASEDKNSYWIAHRACRNLVKQFPERVMDVLGVDEYHYKDRNFFRDG